MMPFVETQNIAQVPATSTPWPASKMPEPSMDCIVSPAPPRMGMPALRPVRSAIASERPPTLSQGFTISGMYFLSMPRISSCSSDQHFFWTS